MKISVALIILLITTSLISKEETCPNPYLQGDVEMWNAFSYLHTKDCRDDLTSFFKMEKDDWDDGWGWAKYDDPEAYMWELPKMMYAARLFWGFSDDFSIQGTWSSRHLTEGPTSTLNDNPQLHAVARNSNIIELFYRGTDHHLRQLTLTGTNWYAGYLPSSQIGTDISTYLAYEKNQYYIDGEPAILSSNAEKIDVFARSGPYLYHFLWSASIGWKVEHLTELTRRTQPLFGSDRYFIMSNPVAICRSNGRFDIFANDNYGDLIHYSWSEGYGWSAEDLTFNFGREYTLTNEPIAFSFNGESLDVFGIAPLGNLLHFHWSANSGWQAHNVTKDLGTRLRISGVPAAISRSAGSVDVFARSCEGNNLIHYHYDSMTWTVEDVTELTRNYSFVWAIFDDPVVLCRNSQSYDIFAKDYYNRLTHYYWQESIGWNVEDLSYETRGNSINGKIVALSTEPNRIDIFGRSSGDNLLHYYWYYSLGWIFEDAPELATVQIKGDPVIVNRNESSLDVFGTRGPSKPSHYAAAIGPCVNPWHSNQEYAEFASGYIHDFLYKPGNTSDEGEGDANALRGWFVVDRVQMNCPSFNFQTAVRASIMLHEATHMNFWDYSEHQTGPNGSDVDNWIFHTIGDPNAHLGDGTISHDWDESYVEVFNYNHSPYQVAIEYLSDLSEFADWNIPIGAYSQANSVALSIMNNRILNPPGWVPGTPRPLH